nr:FKBP-type peptidyl-prolyl cis-trans isomerase domain-containing protein [Tanacetum cinerariifolium]
MMSPSSDTIDTTFIEDLFVVECRQENVSRVLWRSILEESGGGNTNNNDIAMKEQANQEQTPDMVSAMKKNKQQELKKNRFHDKDATEYDGSRYNSNIDMIKMQRSSFVMVFVLKCWIR